MKFLDLNMAGMDKRRLLESIRAMHSMRTAFLKAASSTLAANEATYLTSGLPIYFLMKEASQDRNGLFFSYGL